MNLKLRKSNLEDSNILFQLANDFSVRNNSFNNQTIELEEHENWYKSKLKDPKTIIFIAEVFDEFIGQIRIDIDNSSAMISYAICKNHRKKGYGTEILVVLENLVKSAYPEIQELIGRVKYDNIGSQKVLEKLNYIRIDEAKYIEYRKKLV